MLAQNTLPHTVEKSTNEAFLKDLNKPDLQNLAYVLRHPETWPKRFVWDFSYCATCAMGLARALWTEVQFANGQNRAAVSAMAREFAMPFTQAQLIFGGDAYGILTKSKGHLWWKRRFHDWSSVTPEMVADQIDAYVGSVK